MVKSKKASGLVEVYNGLTNTEPEPPGSEHKPLPDFDAKYPASSWYVGKGGVRGTKGIIPAGSRVVVQDFTGESEPAGGYYEVSSVPHPERLTRILGKLARRLTGVDPSKSRGEYSGDDIKGVAKNMLPLTKGKHVDPGCLAVAMALDDAVNGRPMKTPV